MVDANPSEISSHRISSRTKIGILLLLIFGFISSFVGGYILGVTLKAEPQASLPSATPGFSSLPTASSEFPLQSGKRYFEDTVIAITKSLPRKVLVATMMRTEQTNQFIHNNRVSFFDGTNWKRKLAASTYQDSQVHPDNIIKQWEIEVDKSRVLKEKTQGEINVDDVSVRFDTGELLNEMSLRSLPGYTKFMSRGQGVLNINGVSVSAYIVYSRIYSLDASQIQFYSEPFGLTTAWLVFWDERGNFYHVDTTQVENPTPIYETHRLAILEEALDQVTKTFTVESTIDTSVIPPENFTFQLQSPLNHTLSIKRLDLLNKNEGGAYQWYMGNMQGTVVLPDGEKINGFGLVEYIHK